MSLVSVLTPFLVAFIIVLSIAFILRLSKNNTQKNRAIDENICGSLNIAPAKIDKIRKMNSIPNDPFRIDRSLSCLDYIDGHGKDFVDIENSSASNHKNEDAIISCLGGKI